MEAPPNDAPAPENVAPHGRLAEVALLFTRLGFTAFGGPAAHLGLMEEECVKRRGWLDRQHFLDLVAAINFIPGPNSTELAIHLGLIRAGRAGLFVAGACFILPAMLIILPIAWAYVNYGSLPQARGMMAGVNACVVAILLVVTLRLAAGTIRRGFEASIALAATAAIVLLETRMPGLAIQPEILVLAVAALIGVMRERVTHVALPLLIPLGAGDAATSPTSSGNWLWAMIGFFLKVGATLYGSGYVLVSYLRSGLVEGSGWLTERQLLDAVSVGQVTPGPLLTTATFIGYVVGQRLGGGTMSALVGAVAATVAIFLPSFILVLCLAPVLQRLRQLPAARAALDAMNAAVVGLLAVVTARLAWSALAPARQVSPAAAAITAISLALLLWRELNPTYLIAAAAIIGALMM